MNRTQYKRALRDARARHDARFAIDHPKPTASTIENTSTAMERATGYLWVIWLVLAVAGAIISAPHTMATLRAVLPDASEAGLAIYSIAGFVGIEAGLIGLALVSALKTRSAKKRKTRSLKGLMNALYIRFGSEPPYDLSHLPDRAPSTGGWLVAGLFCAALVFNQVDVLRDVLGEHRDAMLLISRAVTGVLGPGLLLISGHRFAQEVVKSAARAQRDRLAKAEAAWQRALQASWNEHGEQWLDGALGVRDVPERSGTKTERVEHVPPRVERTVQAFRDVPGLSLSDLADTLNVSRTTAHRYAKQAADYGLLEQDENGRYFANGRG
jgi:hypothetical protein